MKFTYSSSFKAQAPAIFPVFFKKKKYLPSGKKAFDAIVGKALKSKVFEGSPGEIHTHVTEKGNVPKAVVFVSMGDPTKLKPSKVLEYLGSALQAVKKEKGNDVAMYVPRELAGMGEAVAESFVLGNYDPAKYKTGKAAKKLRERDIKTCVFIGAGGKGFKDAVSKGALLADATNWVKDAVNGPPNIVTAEFLENEAVSMGKQFGYKVTVLKKKELEKMGMNALLLVNRGSKTEARLVVMEYRPAAASKEAPVVIAGKGIIFDSGGYNLKPSGYIEDMHLDMAGAGSVLGVFKILKKLNIPVPVIGILPITENCIGPDAYKPSEIVKTYSGKTVEITNTDAEGRMVLCDALAYGVKMYKPQYLIDIATLTGSCMVALGEEYAGLFGTDKGLLKTLRKAGRDTNELVWPLPLDPVHSEAMKGEITDLKNGENGRYAGASKGAAFLKEFVGKAKWAHLDIAGPAYVKQPKKYGAKRATGFGVRLLSKALELLAEKKMV